MMSKNMHLTCLWTWIQQQVPIGTLISVSYSMTIFRAPALLRIGMCCPETYILVYVYVHNLFKVRSSEGNGMH